MATFGAVADLEAFDLANLHTCPPESGFTHQSRLSESLTGAGRAVGVRGAVD